MKPDTTLEREKWERYYRSLSIDAVLNESAEAGLAHEEVARSIAALLPREARILEAGCGSGRHSLELSRQGFTDITLLDFSEQAVECARSVFRHFSVDANFVAGDVFAGSAQAPEFDLVFNSGVLEHYSFEEQVAFIKGMASFSKRYVLVLVPNRHCHWYWIYRVQAAACGAWPFGYEKPASSYDELIRASGLHCLGRAYLAADTVLWAIRGIRGMDEPLREIVLEAHRSGIIPIEQRCYLVAFLASVNPQDAATAQFMRQPPDGDLEDHLASVAADRLAAALSARR